MSQWERWAKRLTKSFVWVGYFYWFCYMTQIEPTAYILFLCITAGIVNSVLDEILPTATTDKYGALWKREQK